MDRRQKISRAHSMVVLSEREFKELSDPHPGRAAHWHSQYWYFRDRRGMRQDRRGRGQDRRQAELPYTGVDTVLSNANPLPNSKWDEAARLGIEFAEWWNTCKDMNDQKRTIEPGSMFALMAEKYLRMP